MILKAETLGLFKVFANNEAVHGETTLLGRGPQKIVVFATRNTSNNVPNTLPMSFGDKLGLQTLHGKC